jgi:hypothetical protein
MDWNDTLRLLHPFLAVIGVFPLLGVVGYFAWQTRERNLQKAKGEKSKISATSGTDHLNIGRWLASGVIILTLLGLGHPLFAHGLEKNLWQTNPGYVGLLVGVFGITCGSLILLVRSQTLSVIWAGLTAAGILFLGLQEGIYRRDNEWYFSHFYIGMTVAFLMIISLAIVQNIYQDRTGRWRKVHVALNTVALLLFLAQGATGVRDLLEIPLTWQEPFVYSCDFTARTCPKP